MIFSQRGEKISQVIQRLAAEYGSDCAGVRSGRQIVDFARAQGWFVMKAQEFAWKLQGASSQAGTSLHKELDTGEDLSLKRGPETRGSPRKLLRHKGRAAGRLSDFEQALRVLGRDAPDGFDRHVRRLGVKLRQLLRDKSDIGRFVAFAPVRNGREVGAICFD